MPGRGRGAGIAHGGIEAVVLLIPVVAERGVLRLTGWKGMCRVDGSTLLPSRLACQAPIEYFFRGAATRADHVEHFADREHVALPV